MDNILEEIKMSSTDNIIKEVEQKRNDKMKNKIRRIIRAMVPFLVLGLITAHFIWASVKFSESRQMLGPTCCDGFGMWLILYSFIIFGYSYSYVIKPYGLRPLNKLIWRPLKKIIAKIFGIRIAEIAFYLIVLAGVLTFLVYDCWEQPERLISLAGLVMFLLFGFTFSKHRRHIRWYTIIWGLILQFGFGLFTLRWDTGREIFGCIGDKVTIFLEYAKQGAAFVYGDQLVLVDQVFAFSAISTIYFLGFMINILYHLGIMQVIIINVGLFLQGILGTSICESVNSAANIFLGQSEAPLLIKPYLPHFTASEIHAVLTAGFCSVSGSVLAAYIAYGASAAHLITASVMAAPAGLVYSKLMYPETEQTAATKDTIALTDSEYSSLVDAASQGANQATAIILGIIANLIAFIATVYFFNGVLGWLGYLVGFTGDETWTLELIVGYIFTPISFMMGVPWEDCQDVGMLIGLKIIVNEFAAFEKFSTIKESLDERSVVIATFAICGFGNPGSIGLMISALGSLMPNKTSIVSEVVFSAFISGAIVCFTTACIAGLLSSS